jgi:hypothetical protein
MGYSLSKGYTVLSAITTGTQPTSNASNKRTPGTDDTDDTDDTDKSNKKDETNEKTKDRNGRCQFNSSNNNRSTNTIFSCSNKKGVENQKRWNMLPTA